MNARPLLMKLHNRPWLNSLHLDAKLIISFLPTHSTVDEGVTRWAKRDNGVDIVSTMVRQAVNVVTFQIRSAVTGIERRVFLAALALSLSSLENIGGDLGGAFVTGSAGLVPSRHWVAGRYSLCAKLIQRLFNQSGNLRLKPILVDAISTYQIEDYLLCFNPIVHNRLNSVAVVDVFAAESIFVAFGNKQQQRSVILQMVQHHVVAVAPRVIAFSTLTEELVSAVRQIAVSIPVAISNWIGHRNHCFFERALTYAGNPQPTERGHDVPTTMKDLADEISPRHLTKLPILIQEHLHRSGCKPVNEANQ